MNKRSYISAVAILMAFFCTASAADLIPSGFPQDPAVSTGVLPNGVTYYIVSNSSDRGMAEFALVSRQNPVETGAGDIDDPSLSRLSVTAVSRFGHQTVRKYIARNGFPSQVCGRKPYPLVRFDDDAIVYRFGTFPVAGRESVVDSTLLMMFSIIDDTRSVRQHPTGNAVIVSGDIDKETVLYKMKLLSLLLPEEQTDPVADTSYFWKESDSLDAEIAVDPGAEASRLTVMYSSPRTPRKYMSSAIPAVSEHMAGILSRILSRRIDAAMRSAGVPASDVRCRYTGSSDQGGDEKLTVSLNTDNGTVRKAVEVLSGTIANLDVNGVLVDEYSAARNEYLVQQYRECLDPVICNSWYVDKCISAYLYGSSIVSKKDSFSFLARRRMPDSTSTRLFNNYMTEFLDGTRNLSVKVVSDSARIDRDTVRDIFDRAWKAVSEDCTYVSYGVNMAAAEALPAEEYPKLKVTRTYREPVSGGTMWLFENGLRVVYKRMDTGGLFYYNVMVRGGFSVISGLRRGEGAFLSDILQTYDISGLRADDFNSLMQAGGITMSASVGISDLDIYGMAPRPSLPLLFRCLTAVANERTLNSREFDYYRECEILSLKARKGSFRDRRAAIDSLMCPSYIYSSYKSPENLYPDAAEKAMDFFESNFSRMNDGVITIIGDMEETSMKRLLQKCLGGFRTEPLSVARIYLPYQPISGWTTHIVEGHRQSLDVVMSFPLQLSSENYMKMEVSAAALESELNRRLCGAGAAARVYSNFSAYPQERVNMMIYVYGLDVSGLPVDEVQKDPLVLLYDVRAVLADLSVSDLPEDRLSMCRDVEKNRILSVQQDPWYWISVVRTRFLDGKDLNTKCAEKIDAVTASQVREMIGGLDSSSKVEYVVR